MRWPELKPCSWYCRLTKFRILLHFVYLAIDNLQSVREELKNLLSLTEVPFPVYDDMEVVPGETPKKFRDDT